MLKPVNPSMITLAREFQGLTQKELSQRIGITQGAISKIELGLLPANEDVLSNLSSELGFPEDFFTREGGLYEPNLYYRKRFKTSKKILAKAKAEMNLMRLSIQQLLKCFEFDTPPIPYFDVERDGSPEIIANKLREFWQIPKGPIIDLVELIESKGIIIIYSNFESDDINGSGMFTMDRVPIIYVNGNVPMDRIRFTICHELFHIIAHVNSSVDEIRDVEKEANQFASEFLMPESEIQQHFRGRITLSLLADLKRYWLSSMQSLLMSAKKVNAITDRHYRTLWIEMSKRNMRKREPKELDPPFEKPKLLNLIIDTMKEELEYTEKEIASLLCVTVDFLRDHIIQVEKPRFKLSLGELSSNSSMRIAN